MRLVPSSDCTSRITVAYTVIILVVVVIIIIIVNNSNNTETEKQRLGLVLTNDLSVKFLITHYS